MSEEGFSRRAGDDNRLSRIENKIDQLSEALINIARAEEKLIAIEKNNFAHYERMNRLSNKIDDLENMVMENNRTISFINKFFWILMTVVCGAAISIMTNVPLSLG